MAMFQGEFVDLDEDSGYDSDEEGVAEDGQGNALYEIVTWDADEGLSDTENEALDIIHSYTDWVVVEKHEDWDADPEIYFIAIDATIIKNITTNDMWYEYNS